MSSLTHALARVVQIVLAGVLAVGVAPQALGPSTAAAAEEYTPPAGVKVNRPLGRPFERRAILDHLVRSIDNVPRKGQIMVASWNIRSNDFVDALVRAHRRKRSVRVVIDRLNANAENPNYGFRRLRRELASYGNENRPVALQSGAVKCRSACRGQGGIAHTKFYLFSQSGTATNVVVNSSANATDLAAGYQWNDAYTVREKPVLYEGFKAVFEEMYRDENVEQPYRTVQRGRTLAEFYPYTGAGTEVDPTLADLAPVQCTGARNTSSRRTKIRIAMTSWHGDRGTAIAHRVRQLANSGCDVKIVYAVAGNEVLRILRREGRRPVPMRQIVQDWNRDGVYDRYLHMKVLTIKGRYAEDRTAAVTVNGSANWTPVALVSDEAVVTLRNKRVLEAYNAHIDFLFGNPPPRPRAATTPAGTARTETEQPVVTEDGDVLLPPHLPLGTTVNGIDPYAKIED